MKVQLTSVEAPPTFWMLNPVQYPELRSMIRGITTVSVLAPASKPPYASPLAPGPVSLCWLTIATSSFPAEFAVTCAEPMKVAPPTQFEVVPPWGVPAKT